MWLGKDGETRLDIVGDVVGTKPADQHARIDRQSIREADDSMQSDFEFAALDLLQDWRLDVELSGEL